MAATDGDRIFTGEGNPLHLVVDDGEGVGGYGEMKGRCLTGLEMDAAEAAEGADGDGDAGVEGREIELGYFVAIGGAGVGEADA